MEVRPPFPQVIRLEPASACNLRCRHCPTGVTEMVRSIMKPDVFERALQEIEKHIPGIRVAVLYHGGEPFLNKHFLSMVRRVKNLDIPFVKTVSNAMLVKPEMYEKIVTSGLDSIEFSVDGQSQEENDAIRQRSNFEKICEVIIGIVETNHRLGGNLKVCVSTTQFQEPGNFQPDELPPIPKVLSKALTDITHDVEFKTNWAQKFPSTALFEDFDIIWDRRPDDEPAQCALLVDTFSIRWNGDVVPCCFDLNSRGVVGNIMNQSLEEIWNGDRFVGFRQAFAGGDFPPLCADCSYVTGPKYFVHRHPSRSADGEQSIVLASDLGRAS